MPLPYENELFSTSEGICDETLSGLQFAMRYRHTLRSHCRIGEESIFLSEWQQLHGAWRYHAFRRGCSGLGGITRTGIERQVGRTLEADEDCCSRSRSDSAVNLLGWNECR